MFPEMINQPYSPLYPYTQQASYQPVNKSKGSGKNFWIGAGVFALMMVIGMSLGLGLGIGVVGNYSDGLLLNTTSTNFTSG